MILVFDVDKDDVVSCKDGKLVVEVRQQRPFQPEWEIVGTVRTYEESEDDSFPKHEMYLMVNQKGSIRLRADYA